MSHAKGLPDGVAGMKTPAKRARAAADRRNKSVKWLQGHARRHAERWGDGVVLLVRSSRYPSCVRFFSSDPAFLAYVMDGRLSGATVGASRQRKRVASPSDGGGGDAYSSGSDADSDAESALDQGMLRVRPAAAPSSLPPPARPKTNIPRRVQARIRQGNTTVLLPPRPDSDQEEDDAPIPVASVPARKNKRKGAK